MVAVPAAIAVTAPVFVTVATAGLLELQVTEFVALLVVLSDKVAVAVNCWVCPTVSVAFVGEIAILVITCVLTVSVVEPVTPPLVAEIEVVPVATAVASPELSIVAALGEEELQVDCAVTSLVVLSPNVAVAVNC
ncbi:MAG: hypothetical protein JWO20_3065 [Candidatus Angelobacter sp.]|nr:hypothetical protein [Candidatus Angelobacter sp.]